MASANANLTSQSLDAIAVALSLGARRDVSNKRGLTPVHVAARIGSKVALQALLQNFSSLRDDRLLLVAQHFSPIIDSLKNLFMADRGTLFLVDEPRKKLVASIATISENDRHGVLHIDLEWTQGIIGMCFQKIIENNNSEMDQRPKKWIRTAGYPDLNTCKSPLRVLNVPNVLDEPAFYQKVDDHSAYQTVSVMCIPIYSVSQLLAVAPDDPTSHKQSNKAETISSLSIVGIVQLINKINPKKSRNITAKNNFIPFTQQDCIRACSMVNAYNSTVQKIFDTDISYMSSLNSAVEDALRLDVPWRRIINRLIPIKKTLRALRLDVNQVEALHDPCYESGYHFDRSRLTHRMLENSLGADFDNVSFNSCKSFRLLQSSALSCLNTRASNGDSPLMKAVICQRDDLVQMLLKSGANPYFVNSRGNTALHLAALSNNCTTLHLLIAAVCDPFAINEAGHTPRFLCELAIKKVLHLHGHKSKDWNNNHRHDHNHDQANTHKDAWDYLRNSIRDSNMYHKSEMNGQSEEFDLDNLAIDRLQALTAEEKITSDMFSKHSIGREIIDLCKRLRDNFACRRMLLAAEAIWLRVLNRGHTNEGKLRDGGQVSTILPLPSKPKNVIHQTLMSVKECCGASVLIGWDAGDSIKNCRTTLFEILGSPDLPIIPLVIGYTDAKRVAQKNKINRKFAVTVKNLQIGVLYRFKVVAVNSCGCSPESFWSFSLEASSKNQQDEMISAAALHPKDNIQTQQLKCMYWEGLISLPSLKVKLAEQPHGGVKNSDHQKKSEELLQWEKQDKLLQASIRRGDRIRHLRSLRRRSNNEVSLRMSSKILAFWINRNFAACDDVESVIYHRVVDSSTPTGGVLPSITLGNMQSGYSGLDICKFHIRCVSDNNDTGSVILRQQITPLPVARGNPAISFVFTYDGKQPAKIRKSKIRSNLAITISAFTSDLGTLPADFRSVAQEHNFSIPVKSTSVVVTRGRLEFGNGVVTVLCPTEIFSLSNVIYYITIPRGAFEVGSSDLRSPWFDCPKIERCVRTSNSQALWGRCDQCPIRVRKQVWREIQLAEASVNHTVLSTTKPPKVEIGTRPIIKTHTPPMTLRKPKKVLKKMQNNNDNEEEICQMCQNHIEPNAYFVMKTTKNGDRQCWHPCHEMCEVCGHEWVEDTATLAKMCEQSQEHEAEFLHSPSLASEHFFCNSKTAQRLRFSPYMLKEVYPSHEIDPTLWMEDTIIHSVLHFSSKNIGPFLALEKDYSDENMKNITRNDKPNLAHEKDTPENTKFSSLSEYQHFDAPPVINPVVPSTQMITKKLLDMYENI
jgi:hypothetical protein